MTADELRAKADLVRDYLRSEGSDAIPTPVFAAMLTTADRVLAENPADDAEPVTADRLRAIGWQTSPGSPAWVCASNGDLSIHVRTDGTDYRLYQGVFFVRLPTMQTMGDVRRLCAAIGITTT